MSWIVWEMGHYIFQCPQHFSFLLFFFQGKLWDLTCFLFCTATWQYGWWFFLLLRTRFLWFSIFPLEEFVYWIKFLRFKKIYVSFLKHDFLQLSLPCWKVQMFSYITYILPLCHLYGLKTTSLYIPLYSSSLCEIWKSWEPFSWSAIVEI